ncbi:hypothetical protein ACQPZP_42760 [Spirillospora sp. CA-142024]|uniref:hypothetical protein n=1 Tax=Spirillospora sp. CA-142024 TaxID=3240036 RepID=UPI003D8AD8F0
MVDQQGDAKSAAGRGTDTTVYLHRRHRELVRARVERLYPSNAIIRYYADASAFRASGHGDPPFWFPALKITMA